MKHLLTAALIATALASPVRGDGDKYYGENAETVISAGEVLSTGFIDHEDGTLRHYLLVRYDGRVFSCIHTLTWRGVYVSCSDEYDFELDRYDPNGG
jgi:hypothetical protein